MEPPEEAEDGRHRGVGEQGVVEGIGPHPGHERCRRARLFIPGRVHKRISAAQGVTLTPGPGLPGWRDRRGHGRAAAEPPGTTTATLGGATTEASGASVHG